MFQFSLPLILYHFHPSSSALQPRKVSWKQGVGASPRAWLGCIASTSVDKYASLMKSVERLLLAFVSFGTVCKLGKFDFNSITCPQFCCYCFPVLTTYPSLNNDRTGLFSQMISSSVSYAVIRPDRDPKIAANWRGNKTPPFWFCGQSCWLQVNCITSYHIL